MVFIPMPMTGRPMGAPSSLGLKLRPWFYTLLTGLVLVSIARMLCQDPFGALFLFLICSLGFYAVQEANMMLLMSLGFMLFINSIFDTVILVLRFSRVTPEAIF